VLWLPSTLLLLLLLLQCGGTDLAVRAAKPILSLMGKSVMHLGDPGAGQVAKICNNLVRGIDTTACGNCQLTGPGVVRHTPIRRLHWAALAHGLQPVCSGQGLNILAVGCIPGMFCFVCRLWQLRWLDYQKP
jgi:hypothetical protein